MIDFNPTPVIITINVNELNNSTVRDFQTGLEATICFPHKIYFKPTFVTCGVLCNAFRSQKKLKSYYLNNLKSIWEWVRGRYAI